MKWYVKFMAIFSLCETFTLFRDPGLCHACICHTKDRTLAYTDSRIHDSTRERKNIKTPSKHVHNDVKC